MFCETRASSAQQWLHGSATEALGRWNRADHVVQHSDAHTPVDTANLKPPTGPPRNDAVLAQINGSCLTGWEIQTWCEFRKPTLWPLSLHFAGGFACFAQGGFSADLEEGL